MKLGFTMFCGGLSASVLLIVADLMTKVLPIFGKF